MNEKGEKERGGDGKRAREGDIDKEKKYEKYKMD